MRLTRHILPAAMLCIALITPVESHAQALFPSSNGKALAGVKAVDAIVEIQAWLGMDGERERFQANVQSAFELGLRRDGLVVEKNAPNYLFCEVKLAQAGGIISYSYQVTYYIFETAGVHRLLWKDGGIVTGGRNKIGIEDVAKNCVDTIANEWLKWNPRR